MRQGPNYFMPVQHGLSELPVVVVPMELAHEFESVEYIKWTENKDGTFTVTIFDKYPN